MLGRLEMSVDECIAAYTGLFATIFDKKASCLPVDIRGNIQGQFDSKKLEKSIKKVVQEQNHGAMEPFRCRDDGTCRGERKCRV
jgi:calcium-independent phospholipase A2-gamma